MLGARLLRGSIEDERARTKNGLRRILSLGAIRLYRLLFVKTLLYLFAGVISLLVPAGHPEVRYVFALTFIISEWLLVLLLNRADAQRRVIRIYDLHEAEDRANEREDRADAREDKADAREVKADARATRADEREDRRDAREDIRDAERRRTDEESP